MSDQISGNPLITIITSTFNAVKDLPITLNSIRSQCYKSIEYIVIDGGSEDGTVELLQSNQDIVDFWISEPDSGIYEAWNKGVERASGSWLIFLGAGDQLPPEWLERVAVTSVDNDLVYGDLAIMEGRQNDRLMVRLRGMPWEVAQKKLHLKMTLFHVGMAHSRTLFDETRYDESLKIVGDWEFFLRAPVKRAQYIPEVIQAKMAMGGVTTSVAGMETHFREWLIVLRGNNLRPPWLQYVKWKVKLMLSRSP